jgi:hypothetical protein
MTSYGSDDESEMAQLADAIDVSLSQLLPSTETPTSPSASSIGTPRLIQVTLDPNLRLLYGAQLVSSL